jgi:hypothetical protein
MSRRPTRLTLNEFIQAGFTAGEYLVYVNQADLRYPEPPYYNLSNVELQDIALERNIDPYLPDLRYILTIFDARDNDVWINQINEAIATRDLDNLSHGQLIVLGYHFKISGMSSLQYQENAMRAVIVLTMRSAGAIQLTTERAREYARQLPNAMLLVVINRMIDDNSLNNSTLFITHAPDERGDSFIVINREEMIEIIATSNIDPHLLDILVPRHKRSKLFAANRRIKELYKFLYPYLPEQSLWDKPIHPLEAYLLTLPPLGRPTSINEMNYIRSLLVNLVIFTPEEAQLQNYPVILEGIVTTAHVLTRGDLPALTIEQIEELGYTDRLRYIEKLKQTELLEIFNLEFRSRSDPYTNYNDSFEYPQFFLIVNNNNKTHSINQDTVTDSGKANTIYFAFGSPLSYYTYEVDDFLGAFSPHGSRWDFFHPEDYSKTFTGDEINDLYELTSGASNDPELSSLNNLIYSLLQQQTDPQVYINRMKEQLRSMPQEQKNIIRDFFHQLFLIGMTMRRWQGPGHPYPLRERDTFGTCDPTNRVIQEMYRAYIALDEPSRAFVFGLRLLEYPPDTMILTLGSTSLSAIWADLNRGEYCIRVASSKLIGTAYYYLRELFEEATPGFDGTGIENVQ